MKRTTEEPLLTDPTFQKEEDKTKKLICAHRLLLAVPVMKK
jgi:hypothetical protein